MRVRTPPRVRPALRPAEGHPHHPRPSHRLRRRLTQARPCATARCPMDLRRAVLPHIRSGATMALLASGIASRPAPIVRRFGCAPPKHLLARARPATTWCVGAPHASATTMADAGTPSRSASEDRGVIGMTKGAALDVAAGGRRVARVGDDLPVGPNHVIGASDHVASAHHRGVERLLLPARVRLDSLGPRHIRNQPRR
jgi:hypothetical protein